MGLFGKSKRLESGTRQSGKTIGKSNKQKRRALFYGEGGGWDGLFGTKVQWREGRVKGDNRFSVAELEG